MWSSHQRQQNSHKVFDDKANAKTGIIERVKDHFEETDEELGNRHLLHLGDLVLDISRREHVEEIVNSVLEGLYTSPDRVLVSLLVVIGHVSIRRFSGLTNSAALFDGHQRARMLHLENGVLAKVDESLELLLLAGLDHRVVEVGLLRLFDLRLLPLLDVRFLDLEVHALDLLVATKNLNPAQERLEVIEDGTGCFEEPG